MIVYVDLVFLTNLAVDGTVLLATAKARRLHPRRWRISASAVLGASYAAALFWADVPYLYSLGAKLFVSVVMVLLAFGYGGPLAFLRTFGVFYTVNFATLGGVIGIGTLLSSAGSPWSGMTVTQEGGLVLDWRMQLGLFAAAFAISVALYRGASEGTKRKLETEALTWQAEIRIDGETWQVPALLDTGNRLYDPVTRIPVMIMEASVWSQRLPAGWCDRLQKESADMLVTELDESARDGFAWISRLRLVPYRGVNGSARLMMAIKPDAVILTRADRPAQPISRVLVGLDGGSLSSDGGYRAILHPDMLTASSDVSVPSQPA